jgi:dipeptidyl aminopeptidase/acylaminoacyl peptidase
MVGNPVVTGGRSVLRRIAVIGFACLTLNVMAPTLWLSHLAAAEPLKRRITILDSIEFAHFDEQGYGLRRFPLLVASPDGTKALFSTTQGDVSANRIVTRVYVVEGLTTRPSVGELAEFSSGDSEAAVSGLQWVNNDRIVFRAQTPESGAQAYYLDVRSRALHQLTSDTVGVAGVRASKDGSTIAYLPYPELSNDCRRSLLARQGVVTPSDSVASLVLCHVVNPPGAVIPVADLVIVRNGKTRHVPLSLPSNLAAGHWGVLYISPNGRYVALQTRLGPDQVPESWKHLSWPMTDYPIYTLFDVETGQFKRLVDGPNYVTAVTWSQDSETAFVSSYRPADITDIAAAPSADRYLLAVDMGSGRIETLADGDYEYCNIGPHQEITFRAVGSPYAPATAAVTVRNTGGAWRFSKSNHESCEGDTSAVSIQQSANEPPRLVSAKGVTLFDPNPSLSSVELGRVAPIEWKDSTGRTFAGRIFYPPDYDAKRRYPLTIQTHGGGDPTRFTLDGESAAGYAGQYLASHGILVVQIPEINRTLREENSDNLHMIECLIDTLLAQGHIDTTRMAIQAWSRTGMHVRYLLLHSRYKFVAAAFVDSMRMSYVQWVLGQNAYGGQEQAMFEDFYGVAPVGDGLKAWIPDSLEMSMNHVGTAIREAVFQPEEVIICMEAYAVARKLGRPYELVYLPLASHDPVRPSDRLEVQGGTADWFLYWLLNYRDADPAKAEQYRRWDTLRAQSTRTAVN